MNTLDIRNEEKNEIGKIIFGDIDPEGEYPDHISVDENGNIKVCCSKGVKHFVLIEDEIEYFIAALKKARELGWWE